MDINRVGSRAVIVPFERIFSKTSTCFFFPSILQSVFTRMAVVKALEKISEAKFLKWASNFCVNSYLRVSGCFADKPPSRFSDTTRVHRGRHPVAASLRTSSVFTFQSSWQVSRRDACRHFFFFRGNCVMWHRAVLTLPLSCREVQQVLPQSSSDAMADQRRENDGVVGGGADCRTHPVLL